MDTFEAIKTRRSIGKVKDTSVPNHVIDKILEAGTYAPNHFRTEPWRFFVLKEKGRTKLGEVMADISIIENANLSPEGLGLKVKKAKNNPLRAPVIIAVGVEPSDKDNVIEIEEYAAVHCSIQNMLLAAHALGLGSIWRTGKIIYHPKIKEFFGLSEKGQMTGFIYLGYPDMEPKDVNKTPITVLTKWIE
ncbi:nitroreductase [Fictibacillus nanhaiensis]|uniref:nitroreductase family protein n=1 Tax=Fictibacillus nanhaiensis TaxID=742169 RepID=UPI001C955EFB|nr:nitroreductase [Fictibacillus nanhaiensis]MBY6037603.1 nitroreductase [Fictibacillus nanhaiensis]